MASDSPLDVLLQGDARARFRANGGSAWTTVYRSWHNELDNGAEFAAFAPPEFRDRALSQPSWDMRIGNGLPGFEQSYGGEAPVTRYLRFGNDEGLEPVVIIQEHHGGRPRSLPQLAEEFRLYHNLWVSPDGSQVIKVNDDGSEYVAAEVTQNEVRVRTKLLRQFQAGRQLDLLLFVDSVQFVPSLKSDDSVAYDDLAEEIGEPDARIDFHASDGRSLLIEKGPFSRLLGTRVVAAPDQTFAGIWPFDEETERFPEFIIGEDDNGRDVLYSCDPDLLADYFGQNAGAPHYLTPVFFRRDVLLKYYEDPDKYSVDDGYLRCKRLWGVHIDNDHPEHVSVFLGDLGRDLPASERDYWRSHNIAPTGAISETNYRRSFLAQFVGPAAPDLRFKHVYQAFRADWRNAFGWDLFREPVAADEHVLKRLRIPLNDSQPEFEGQVLSLAKLLVDSLNEAQLGRLLATKVKDEKSIAKLKRWLEQEKYPHAEEDVAVLQQVQRLRSRAAAHRKGSDYEKFLESEIGGDGLVWGFARLLVAVIEVLDRLRRFFLVDGTADGD